MDRPLHLPLPPERRPDLAELIHRVGTLHDTSNNRAVVVTPERCRWSAEADKADTRGLHTRARRAGVLRDLLKTMAPRARLDGTPIMPALAIRPRAQCTILGKRSGTSETLNRTARARAGWRELETLAELRAALPTGEDARKERQRDNQRRRRARKRAGIAPMPWSPTRRPEAVPELDPFAVDLAADFFEEA